MSDTAKAMAILFFDQCAGTSSSSFLAAPVANNPVLRSIMKANGIFGFDDASRLLFAEFLSDMAHELRHNVELSDLDPDFMEVGGNADSGLGGMGALKPGDGEKPSEKSKVDDLDDEIPF